MYLYNFLHDIVCSNISIEIVREFPQSVVTQHKVIFGYEYTEDELFGYIIYAVEIIC